MLVIVILKPIWNGQIFTETTRTLKIHKIISAVNLLHDGTWINKAMLTGACLEMFAAETLK